MRSRYKIVPSTYVIVKQAGNELITITYPGNKANSERILARIKKVEARLEKYDKAGDDDKYFKLLNSLL